MPRNVSGVMSWPAGTTATTNTTISSADYNAFLADLLSDLNAVRPVVAGGTGASTKQGALDNLLDGTTHIDADNLRIADQSDNTKLIDWDASNITTGTTRTITVPDRNVALAPPTSAKTSAYTVTTSDDQKTILCDASSAAFTVTLPAAATAGAGFVVTIKKTDSSTNAVTIDGNGSETIDGATTVGLGHQYASARLISDGSAWSIVGEAKATLGVGQTWHDESANRTINVSYQNTQGRPIQLAVSFNGANSTNSLQVSSDDSTWVTLATLGGNMPATPGFFPVVPDGWYYRIVRTSGATTVIALWAELY